MFNKVGAITIPLAQGYVATTSALWRKVRPFSMLVWLISVRSTPDMVHSVPSNIGASLTIKSTGLLEINKMFMYKLETGLTCDLRMMVNRKEVQSSLIFIDKFNHLRVGHLFGSMLKLRCQTLHKHWVTEWCLFGVLFVPQGFGSDHMRTICYKIAIYNAHAPFTLPKKFWRGQSKPNQSGTFNMYIHTISNWGFVRR